MACKLGIDSSTIRAYEAGRAMMNIRSLVRIAASLDVDAGALLEGIEPSLFDQDS